jgi:hypothetical protein
VTKVVLPLIEHGIPIDKKALPEVLQPELERAG